MKIPGFVAELSLGRPTQNFRTIERSRGSAHLGVSLAAAHEHPPLKEVLLSPNHHSCTGGAGCYHLGASGVCTGTLLCQGDHCVCE